MEKINAEACKLYPAYTAKRDLPPGAPTPKHIDFATAFPGDAYKNISDIPSELISHTTGGKDNKWQYVLVENKDEGESVWRPYKVHRVLSGLFPREHILSLMSKFSPTYPVPGALV